MKGYFATPLASKMGSRMGSSMSLGIWAFDPAAMYEKAKEIKPTEPEPSVPWHEIVTDIVGATSTGFESVMKGIAAYNVTEQQPYGYMQTQMRPQGPTQAEIETQRQSHEQKMAAMKIEEQRMRLAREQSQSEEKKSDKKDYMPIALGVGGAALLALVATVVLRK